MMLVPIQHLQAANSTVSIPDTTEVCKHQCKNIQNLIQKLECNTVQLCIDEQRQLMHHAQASGDNSTVNAIKTKLKAEHTKQVYQNICNIRGTNPSGIMQLHIPQNHANTNYAKCKEWISMTTPAATKQHLQTCNQRHFGQVHGTFPTIPPF